MLNLVQALEPDWACRDVSEAYPQLLHVRLRTGRLAVALMYEAAYETTPGAALTGIPLLVYVVSDNIVTHTYFSKIFEM